jgi:hypothetical protein
MDKLNHYANAIKQVITEYATKRKLVNGSNVAFHAPHKSPYPGYALA